MDEKKIELALQVAKNVRIVDQVTYDQAVLFRSNLKELLVEVDSAFDEQIKTAHAAHKAALAAKKRYADPIEAADAIVKRAVAAWEAELRRKAEEEKALAIDIGVADLVPEAPKTTTFIRKQYLAKVVNKADLLRAVLAGKVDPDLVIPNEAALNALAAQAHELFSVPGCTLEIREIVCSK